jgi:hypothetical protein
MRNNLKQLGESGFQALVANIVDNLKPLVQSHGGAVPWLRGLQRRYPSQRALPYTDASIALDLRTAVPGSGAPKAQPLWLQAAYGAFVSKAGSNYQMQIGVLFPYERCPELRQADSLELIARAWLACKPLVDLGE